MSSEVNISDPAVRAELDKLNKLDGGIPFRASPQHAHHTWAKTFHSSPELYIQPESLAEVEKAITLARRCRKRITTVGCGHSPSDMTCTSSWMMNLDKFNKILDVNKEKNLVTMQAGIRLYQLGAELDKLELAMPNLGSINDQSIAGAISTGTHGSTLRHSILSSSVTSLKITLANSRTLFCSPDENVELFRAALCSLGALGVVTEITFQAVPAFTLHWSQTVYPDSHMLDNWNKDLWTQAEFVRVWWFPYTRRSTVWKASKTDDSPDKMPYKPSYYDTKFGYTIYHNLLYVAQYIPRILPWVEWFVFGMQYGFSTGPKTTQEAIQPSREALLMNCLYSQYVNEWALPLKNGPEALRRLSSWLNHMKPTDPGYVEHGIPFSSKGLWVHAPIEVRVSDTTVALKNQDGTPRKSARPYLDTTCNDGPTLYLNATLYRPYNMDPPCRIPYYQGFEYLMRELGGKPHWAKNFEVTGEQIAEMYGDDLQAFRKVRDEADPEGLFTGPWHRRYLLADGKPRLELEEVESKRKTLPTGGVEVFGSLPVKTEVTDDADYVKKPVFDEIKKVDEVKKEAAAARVAVSKALQDSEDLRMRLQKKVEEKLAREAAEKARLAKIADENAATELAAEAARVQAIEDECVHRAKLQKSKDDKEKARLQKLEDDKVAAAAAAEKARLQKLEEDRAAADAAAFAEAQEQARIQQEEVNSQRRASWEAHEKERIRLLKDADQKLKEQQRQERNMREKEELAVKQARELELKKQQEVQAAKDAEALRLKQESEARELKLKQQQEAQAAKNAEELRLKQESDAKIAREAQELELKKQREAQAARDAEALRVKQESDAKIAREAQELKLQQEREEVARVQAAKDAEALRLKQQADARRVELEEQQRKDELAAQELKLKQEAAARAESERLKKIEDDRIASERESKRIADEKARVQREKEVREESERLQREADARRQEEERIRLERREREEKRSAEERAEQARQEAARIKKAAEEVLAAAERKKRDDEHNAKLAAAEAQRLKEEAAERHAARQQQLKEVEEARQREEYEKRMVAEHNRREAARAEALLRERDEKDRIARVEHDNQVRLEKGRLAREAKEREERLERERLAEDARQIQKRHEVEEKRRRIHEKKEAQRIEIQKKQAERRQAAAAKKAIEDQAAKDAQEERALQQKKESEEKAKKAKEIREAFKAQIAAKAALAAAELEKQKHNRPETPSKARRSLSPKTNGASARPPTPAAKTNDTQPAKTEEHDKPVTFADAVKEDLPTETRPQSSSGDKKSEKSKQATPNSSKAPTSPKAQKIFRPTIGTPTPSVLLAKREGLEPVGSPAQKRIKLEELSEEPAVPVKKEEKAWKPQFRPNSLDELLAEQERERENEEN